MRFNWEKFALGGAALFALTPMSAIGQATSTEVPRAGAKDASLAASQVFVDVNLKDADMLTATRALTARTGIQFVLISSSEVFSPVTLQVSKVTAEDAIRYICTAAGASFRMDDNGVYLIGHEKDFPKDAPAPVVPPPHTSHKIKVLRNNAGEVYWRMATGVPLETRDPFEMMKKFVSLDVNQRQQIEAGVPQLTNNGVTNYHPQPIVSSNIPLSGAEAGNQIQLPGESANQFGGGGQGGFGGGGGQGGFGGGQGGGQGGLGGGQNGLNGAQLRGNQGLVPDGLDFISYDPTDNSLIVQGTEDAINELQKRVAEFDEAPRQVLIKVEFITTTDSLDKDFGVDMLYQRGTVSAGVVPGTFVSQTDPVVFNYATGNVTGQLRTFLSEGKGKVVTAPIVRTLNNQPAILSSVVYTWIFINNVSATNGVLINSSTPEQIQIQTTLAVTPRINNDNTITVALAPNIGSIVGTTVAPDGTELPNYEQQQIAVVARVNNGDTIVLGGLNSKSDNTSVNKVPILGDLPVIGQFFRHTTTNNTDDELLIFVTPTIVDDATTGNPGGP